MNNKLNMHTHSDTLIDRDACTQSFVWAGNLELAQAEAPQHAQVSVSGFLTFLPEI